MSKKYYYGRISSSTQNVARQTADAEELGFHKDDIFIDVASGRNFERPQWKELKAKAYANPGCTIVVHDASRLGRNMLQTLTEIEKGLEAQINFRFVNEDITVKHDDKMKSGLTMIRLLAVFAETQREHMRVAQREGIDARKKLDATLPQDERAYRGRRTKAYDEDKLRNYFDMGLKYAEIAQLLDVSLPTVKRGVKELGLSRNDMNAPAPSPDGMG